jgi:hypothetical protein
MPLSVEHKYRPPDYRIPSLVQLVANNGFGIPIDSGTVARWEVIEDGCRAIDNEIDHTANKAKRHQVMTNSTAFIAGEVDVFQATEDRVRKASKMRDLVKELPDTQRKSFMHNIRKICIITERLRNEPDVQKLSALKRVEGQIYSRLYHTVVPQITADNPKYPEFKKALYKLFRAGNNLDMAIDLPDDANNGRAQVKSSLRNRGVLLKDGAYEVWGFAKKVDKRKCPFMVQTIKFALARI